MGLISKFMMQQPGKQTITIHHGTMIRAGITCKKSFYKRLLNSALLWSRARFSINKKEKYLSVPDHQLAENVILVFGFYKRKNKR